MRARLTYANVISTLALFIALGGGAFAAGLVGSNGVIHGCVSKKTGVLTVVAAGKKCKKSAQAISFNEQGKVGKTGTAGPKGSAGPPPTSSGVLRYTISTTRSP